MRSNCCSLSCVKIVRVRVLVDDEGDDCRETTTRCEHCGKRRTVRRYFGLIDRPSVDVLEVDRIGVPADVA